MKQLNLYSKKNLIDHRKMTTYHPQENGAVESFNKTLAKGLTNICSIKKDDWDDKGSCNPLGVYIIIQKIDWVESIQACLRTKKLLSLYNFGPIPTRLQL
jgi:hypothetical protein